VNKKGTQIRGDSFERFEKEMASNSERFSSPEEKTGMITIRPKRERKIKKRAPYLARWTMVRASNPPRFAITSSGVLSNAGIHAK